MLIKPGYTRVSTILGQWPQFEGVDAKVLEKKAAIGTEVHEAILGLHEDIYLPVSEESAGYFESFRKWYSNKPELKSIGRLYCDKLKITGEIDAIMQWQLEPKEWMIVDWKTSAVKNDKMWQLQGQFYHYLMKENGHQISDRFLFLKLEKDGGIANGMVYKASKELMNVCMSAYICYKYMNKVDTKSQPDSKCSQH